eukprot:153292-Hanusia_phi.AAC.2
MEEREEVRCTEWAGGRGWEAGEHRRTGDEDKETGLPQRILRVCVGLLGAEVAEELHGEDTEDEDDDDKDERELEEDGGGSDEEVDDGAKVEVRPED